MLDFLKIFSMNLVSDIDNILILGTILRRYSYLNITFLAAIILTITRTMYVVLVDGLSILPMFHLLVGMILIYISFKLVTISITENVPLRRTVKKSSYVKAKVLFLLAATDFLICWDGVIVISRITQNISLVFLGIFLSLLISLHFLPLITKLATMFFWINFIAGGFIAQHAIITITQDPWIADWIYDLNELIPEINIINITANVAGIVILIIGVFSYIKHHRITIHK